MDEIQKTSDKKAAQQARMAKARAARAAKRAQIEQAAAPNPEPKREPVSRSGRSSEETVSRSGQPKIDLKPGQVLGRNGEILSRTHIVNGDEFEIPKSKWPEGWEYQWIQVTVTGNGDVVRSTQLQMHQQGWRHVPAERHAGDLLEAGATGAIIKGQMVLVERPSILCEEARQEDLRRARQLISDRNESLKLTKLGQTMADGFETRNNLSGVRLQIDKSLDVLNVPRPEHKLDQ